MHVWDLCGLVGRYQSLVECADTDDGDAEEREEEAEVVGEDGDADDSAPRGRLSWGTSQELGVLHSSTAGAPAVRRSYVARTRSGGAGARRPRPRQPRACLSPTAVPPANISFATLVSPEATPRGRRPWFRSGDALGVGKQQTLGMLEPQHPKLRPIVVQEPGMRPHTNSAETPHHAASNAFCPRLDCPRSTVCDDWAWWRWYSVRECTWLT